MKKQRRTAGSVVRISLGNKDYSYAQILGQGLAFFDFLTKEELEDLNELLRKPILFIIEVYDDVITSGRWKKIGKLPIDERLSTLQDQFIQDPIDPKVFRLYNPNTGEMRGASREECEGLEPAAVWEAEHVESRIRDYYASQPNVWVESLKIKE